MPADLTQLSANELLKLYKQKSTSPVEVTKAILSHIESSQPYYNAYRAIDPENALAQAKARHKGRWTEYRWESRICCT